MASKTVQIYTSDPTGKEISNTDELVEVRVLDHPDLNRAVRLDAYALEVQSLFDTAGQFITVEVVVPGQQACRLVVPNEVFGKVFTTDVAAALAAAEPYSPAGTAAPARRGRAGGTAKRASTGSVSREQRGAVRDWANNNGFAVGNRGRIKDEVMAAFEAAHSNCAAHPQRTSDMDNSALVDRLAAAYNAADADGFAALFTRKAEFVNIFGMRMSGRSGIAAGHRAAFATRLAGTAMTVVDVDANPVNLHTTVLHVEWVLTHTPAATPATLPECRGVLTLVSTSHQGWSSFAAGTNVRRVPQTF